MTISTSTRFESIDVNGEHIVGQFKIGSIPLGHGTAPLVVEIQGAGRVWPLSSVTCLYVESTGPGTRRPAFEEPA